MKQLTGWMHNRLKYFNFTPFSILHEACKSIAKHCFGIFFGDFRSFSTNNEKKETTTQAFLGSLNIY